MYICGSFEDCFHIDNLEITLKKHGLLKTGNKYYYDGYTKIYENDKYLQVWIDEDDSIED